MGASLTASVPSDRELVDRILGGDAEVFRMLVDRESPQIIGICRRILRNSAEAEDVAQEAFLRAYRSMATYRGDGPFAAWIARIAARQAVGRLVSQRPTEQLADTADAGPSADEPEAHALALEQRVAIREAVASLPRSQRDVVALRFFGDLSLQEISRATVTPVGTVKSRLHRAMASLKQSLPSRPQQ